MSSASNHSNIADAPLISVRESAIHGAGGFAKTDITAGTLVAEYAGERITKDESLRRCEAGNEYIFALDDEWDLDGSVPWNQARYLNHSCKPNCVAERLDGRIWIMTRRNIRAGEELTFNYGYNLEDYREHECRCGAAGCVGYMVSSEFYEHVKWQRSLSEKA